MHGGADDSDNAFAVALEPHLGELQTAARAREQQAEALERARAAQRRTTRLSEAELMELIFASLDPDNPRVCEGIDFERIVICEEQPAQAERALEQQGNASADTAPERAGSATVSAPPLTPPDARAWVGASWSDDLGPIIELVDRPQLSPAQAELLRRAPRTGFPELSLRRLDRHRALRHLELFIHICQARGSRWCRVITGKGIESSGEPVLKRLVLEWCVAAAPRPSGAAQVSAWVPELDSYGEWGALILSLRRRA